MSNSIAPGSSADVNVKVTALTTNPNVPVTYKTIILKKNLVNGVNTLTQEMMSATNTKYVIKYDYVLGEDISVPTNCILEFDGGSLSNGIVVGNSTIIEATNNKIFDNITFEGSFGNDVIYAKWFGNFTSSINKAVQSFANKSICVDGHWDYDSVITVPFDTSLFCNNAVCDVDAASGKIFIFYLGLLGQSLQNFIIKLGSTYADTCIEIYGANSVHSNIRGYNSTLEKNLSGSEIALPQIIGAGSWASVTNNVIGVCINPDSEQEDLFYYKTFKTFASYIHTHVRSNNMSGLNSTNLFIKSLFCKYGLSIDKDLNSSTNVDIEYQSWTNAEKAIAIDSEWYNDNYSKGGGCKYNITLWDPSSNHNYIDNTALSVYISRAGKNTFHDTVTTSALMQLDWLSKYFTKKRINRDEYSYNHNNIALSYPQAIPFEINSVYFIKDIILGCATHFDCIKALVEYFGKMNIGRDIKIKFRIGTYNMIHTDTITLLSRLAFGEDTFPTLINAEDNTLFCVDFPTRGATQFYGVDIRVIDYTSGTVYNKTENLVFDNNNELTLITTVFERYYNEGFIDTFNTLPSLSSKYSGKISFASNAYPPRPVYYTGSKWIDFDGYTFNNRKYTDVISALAISNGDVGYNVFFTPFDIPVWYNGTRWVNANNFAPSQLRGVTSYRPTGPNESSNPLLNVLKENDEGYLYYDETLSRYIFAKGITESATTNSVDWREFDGAKAGVARSGATANRPTGSSIYVGFQYYDTDIHKPIWADAINGSTVTWVDATGATV